MIQIEQQPMDSSLAISSLSQLAKANNTQIAQLTRQIQAKRAAISRLASAQDSLVSKLDQSDLLSDTKPWTESILEVSTRADATFSDALLKMHFTREDAVDDEVLLILLMTGVEQDGVGSELLDELKRRLMVSKGRNAAIKARVDELVGLCDGLNDDPL